MNKKRNDLSGKPVLGFIPLIIITLTDLSPARHNRKWDVSPSFKHFS